MLHNTKYRECTNTLIHRLTCLYIVIERSPLFSENSNMCGSGLRLSGITTFNLKAMITQEYRFGGKCNKVQVKM